MNQVARILLVLTCLVWLSGLLPAGANSCETTMQNNRCCAAEPVCTMDCCRVPGHFHDSAIPVAVTLRQLPAGPLVIKMPWLAPLQAPAATCDFNLVAVSFAAPAVPEKIYLLHRALLI
jgi:hypothetical protein